MKNKREMIDGEQCKTAPLHHSVGSSYYSQKRDASLILYKHCCIVILGIV